MFETIVRVALSGCIGVGVMLLVMVLAAKVQGRAWDDLD